MRKKNLPPQIKLVITKREFSMMTMMKVTLFMIGLENRMRTIEIIMMILFMFPVPWIRPGISR